MHQVNHIGLVSFHKPSNTSKINMIDVQLLKVTDCMEKKSREKIPADILKKE